jgi:hypothetical protein
MGQYAGPIDHLRLAFALDYTQTIQHARADANTIKAVLKIEQLEYLLQLINQN